MAYKGLEDQQVIIEGDFNRHIGEGLKGSLGTHGPWGFRFWCRERRGAGISGVHIGADLVATNSLYKKICSFRGCLF